MKPHINYTYVSPEKEILSEGTMSCSSYDDGLEKIHSSDFLNKSLTGITENATFLSAWAVSDGWHVTQYMDSPDGVYSIKYRVRV